MAEEAFDPKRHNVNRQRMRRFGWMPPDAGFPCRNSIRNYVRLLQGVGTFSHAGTLACRGCTTARVARWDGVFFLLRRLVGGSLRLGRLARLLRRSPIRQSPLFA